MIVTTDEPMTTVTAEKTVIIEESIVNESKSVTLRMSTREAHTYTP